jgi:hypothetical protein
VVGEFGKHVADDHFSFTNTIITNQRQFITTLLTNDNMHGKIASHLFGDAYANLTHNPNQKISISER